MPINTHVDLLQCTVSGTPGTGTITVSTASSGFRGFTAADDGKYFSCTFNDGTAWETADQCLYTHAGTTLTRGTFVASSTGSAISLTSAAIVTVGPISTLGQMVERMNLTTVAASPTTSNVTGVIGTLHRLDISGLTANRNLVLPAPTAVDQRMAVRLSVGDDTYALIIIGDTGVSINGGTAATEWSRLFITGEVVILRASSTSNWDVEIDGRIPMVGNMRLSTAASGESAATYTAPTSAGGAWTADVNVGSICTTSTGTFTARRACRVNMVATGKAGAAVADGQYFGVRIYKNATDSYGIPLLYSSGASQFSTVMTLVGALPAAAGDYFAYNYRSQAGSIGLQSSATVANTIPTLFSFEEILNK